MIQSDALFVDVLISYCMTQSSSYHTVLSESQKEKDSFFCLVWILTFSFHLIPGKFSKLVLSVVGLCES